MASTSETGHAKNIANFNLLLQFCQGFGPGYNPSNSALSVGNLQMAMSNAINGQTALTNAKQPYTLAVNARQERFVLLSTFSSRIVNALEASAGGTDEIVKDAKSILRKIRGGRAKAVNHDSETSISVSQQSFDLRHDNFLQLVALVSSLPTYSPNETDLQPTSLTNTGNMLLNLNQQVAMAIVGLSNARLQRNATLYNPQNGLVTLAQDVKKYVKSAFGPSSQQFKQVSGIRFSR